MKRVLWSSVWVVILGLVCQPVLAQGIFDKTADWSGRGTYKAPGKVTYANGTYTMEGNGDDIWDATDEGFFAYTEKTGDWSISGKVVWVNTDNHDWSKIGVMVREQGNVANSAHYWTELRGAAMGDRTDSQWRMTAGASSSNVEVRTPGNAAVNDPNGSGVYLRVSRITAIDMMVSEYSYDGVNWQFSHAHVQPMADTAAYGLAITNHTDNQNVAIAKVSDVKLEPTSVAAGMRVIAEPVYLPGKSVEVSLIVGGGSGTIAVTETPPAGWTIGDISDNGTASGGKITWSLASAKTISYTVTPPASASGGVTFAGTVGAAPIVGSSSMVAPTPLEIFDNHMDIGAVGAAGTAEFDADLNEYAIRASGADIWDNADEFHFAYNKMTGSFMIKATVFVEQDTGTNDWGKAGLMVRDNLSAGSPHYNQIVRSLDMNMYAQWRASQDGSSANAAETTSDHQFGDMEIIRLGNTLSSYAIIDGERQLLHSMILDTITDPVYVGLAVTSHDDGNHAYGYFENVEIVEFPYGIFRDLSAATIVPGEPAEVSLRAEVREGVSGDITIVEDYPEGLTVTGLNARAGTASDDGDKITWKITGATGSPTLDYELNLVAGAPEQGRLSGTYSGIGYSGDIGDVILVFLDLDPDDLGIFQGHQDIGAPGAEGGVIRDGETWKVIGSGHDIWDAADDFHYLWLKAEGDFTMSVEEPYIGAWGLAPSTNTWMKIGIMARQELTAPSKYVIAGLRSSDQAFLIQWRDTNGGGASWDDLTTATSEWNPNYDGSADGISNPTFEEANQGGKIVLQREGDSFSAMYEYDGELWLHSSHDLVMTDPLYVGVAVTSHEAGSTAQGVFKNPQMQGTIVEVQSWMLY